MFATASSATGRRAMTREGAPGHPRGKRVIALLMAVLPILLVHSGPAEATLGGDEASIATDQTQMKATRRKSKATRTPGQ